MEYSTGAEKSPYDLRTFSYEPTLGAKKGGVRYKAKDILDQSKVGICTSISLTQNARKATGKDYSADFQYLLQKLHVGNWDEGSSLSTALKVARNIGMLPEKHWTHTTFADRKLGYTKYVKKLQAVTPAEIERLKKLCVKIKAYAKVPVDRDSLSNAIDESKAGVLARFDLGSEWWRNPIEPVRPPKKVISGHAVTLSNYDGGSFRIANTWGDDWADLGTAYHLLHQYSPTEAWLPYYNEVPEFIEVKLDNRTALMGKLLDALQTLLALLQKNKRTRGVIISPIII